MRNLICFLAVFFASKTIEAKVSLPNIFADHMVLQQNDEVRIWGWSNPYEPITITTSWSKDTVSAKGSNYARWEAILKTPKAGGPYSITIKGYNTIELEDVLIGEVWLCSGQSNMGWTPSAGIDGAKDFIKNAQHPGIRFFTVEKHSSKSPQDNLDGKWQVCTPETMRYFSAVAYFFGERLKENLDVPIGLVNSSWGGSYAETWMPEEPFESDEKLKQAASRISPVDWAPFEPGQIYNAMVHPLEPYNFAGVIWYQGENNTANSSDYHYVFSRLITLWRKSFKSNFPFYYAQIAPYEYHGFSGVEVRQAQLKTLQVPKTGMVVTSDIGDLNDIHPKNKADVGYRLAKLALKKHYGFLQDVVESPIPNKATFKAKKALVTFKNSNGLYASSGTSLFEIAGEDKVFYKAQFKIKNDMVVVWSAKVRSPKYVRFAWSNTAVSNIFNSANLPMSSFTTQDQ